MTQETETINDVIFQISEKTKKNFGFSYNVVNSGKDKTYFERTLAFFKDKDHIRDVNNVIEKLSTKTNKFLLIDGENTFFNFSLKDKLLIADVLKGYLEKNVFIIIFCQTHSIKNAGRFEGLQNFLNNYLHSFGNLYIFCKLDTPILTLYYDHFNLKELDHAPIIPDQSEIDDILLVYCFKKLTEGYNKTVYIKSKDNFDWLDDGLKNKIRQAKIISPIDIINIRKKEQHDKQRHERQTPKSRSRSRSRSRSKSKSKSRPGSTSNSNKAKGKRKKLKKTKKQPKKR